MRRHRPSLALPHRVTSTRPPLQRPVPLCRPVGTPGTLALAVHVICVDVWFRHLHAPVCVVLCCAVLYCALVVPTCICMHVSICMLQELSCSIYPPPSEEPPPTRAHPVRVSSRDAHSSRKKDPYFCPVRTCIDVSSERVRWNRNLFWQKERSSNPSLPDCSRRFPVPPQIKHHPPQKKPQPTNRLLRGGITQRLVRKIE